jgi:hypothetical protein
LTSADELKLGASADVEFPADLASTDELERGVVAGGGFPADVASADEVLAGGLAGAIRATRPDHPSPDRAANYSRTSTSQHAAIRRCTSSNAGLPR